MINQPCESMSESVGSARQCTILLLPTADIGIPTLPHMHSQASLKKSKFGNPLKNPHRENSLFLHLFKQTKRAVTSDVAIRIHVKYGLWIETQDIE